MTKMILWQCTTKCNLKCDYCNIPSDKDSKTMHHNSEIQILNVTGGEPFLSNSIYKIPQLYPYLKQIQISTNGLLLKNILKFLTHIKIPTSLSISLHEGHEKEAIETYRILKNSNLKYLNHISFQEVLTPKSNIIHPLVNYIMPMSEDFYGKPNIKITQEMLRTFERLARIKAPIRVYYNHVLNTINGIREMPCSFLEENAYYVDVDGKLHRCPYPDKDCDICYAMCDTVLLFKNHPIRMMYEVLK